MNKIDLFPFFNELSLLKVRLQYLGPIVDQFYIVEANIDFSGKEKGFLLSDEICKNLPYGNKIKYFRKNIDLKSLGWMFKKIIYRKKLSRMLWRIQDAQRNALLEATKNSSENTLVIFGDLDEFPSYQAIETGERLLSSKNLSDNCYSCKQDFYYYNLNNFAINDIFYGSIITTLKYLRKKFPHKLRSNKDGMPHINDGGWHFSYFMEPHAILNKIKAISAVENLSSFNKISEFEIQEKINMKKDLYDREVSLKASHSQPIPIHLKNLFLQNMPQIFSGKN